MQIGINDKRLATGRFGSWSKAAKIIPWQKTQVKSKRSGEKTPIRGKD